MGKNKEGFGHRAIRRTDGLFRQLGRERRIELDKKLEGEIVGSILEEDDTVEELQDRFRSRLKS